MTAKLWAMLCPSVACFDNEPFEILLSEVIAQMSRCSSTFRRTYELKYVIVSIALPSPHCSSSLLAGYFYFPYLILTSDLLVSD